MSIFLKLNRVRASRWIAIVAVSALIPLTAGCTLLQDAAMFWGLGYGYDLLFAPARAMIGTGLLEFINAH